ncbi:MAG: EamA family transporter [Candidatus Nanopelagicales bacterium]
MTSVPEFEDLVTPPHAPAPASAGRVWAALLVVYVVWGSTYLGIKLATESMPAQLALGFRFLVAAAVLAVVVRIRRGPGALRVAPRELGGAALVGVMLLGVGMSTVGLGQDYVPTGVAALLVAVTPVWIVLLRAGTGDRPRLVTWLGVGVGLVGVALLVLPGSDVAAVGSATPQQRAFWSLLIVLGSASWATGSFLQQRIPTPKDALVMSTYEMVAGGLALIAVGMLRGERWPDLFDATAVSWAGWVYLVLVGSLIAFSAFVWLIDHAPISLVSTYAYVNPVVAVALGTLVLGESLTGGVVLGGLIIIGGVMLVVSGERLTRTAA